MKVLSILVFNAIFSFFVAALLIILYAVFEVKGADFPFVYYWACAFVGCLTYESIKYSCTKKDDK